MSCLTKDLLLLAVGDLYVTIGVEAKTNVMVQSWGCQVGRAGPYCPPNQYQVLNIKSIKTDLGQWLPTKDHSKWCIATNLNINLVCIADVNRSPTQYNRYGGALCLNNRPTKEIFRNFLAEQENCQTPIIMNIPPNMDCDSSED